MLYSSAMPGILQRLSTRTPLLSDSATGTWFQQRLGVDHVGGECCDQYNVTTPDVVRELYRAKIEAGADLVQVYTGLIYKGPALVSHCARALARR